MRQVKVATITLAIVISFVLAVVLAVLYPSVPVMVVAAGGAAAGIAGLYILVDEWVP